MERGGHGLSKLCSGSTRLEGNVDHDGETAGNRSYLCQLQIRLCSPLSSLFLTNQKSLNSLPEVCGFLLGLAGVDTEENSRMNTDVELRMCLLGMEWRKGMEISWFKSTKSPMDRRMDFQTGSTAG